MATPFLLGGIFLNFAPAQPVTTRPGEKNLPRPSRAPRNSGTIVDAKTGLPIIKGRIYQTFEFRDNAPAWQNTNPIPFVDGEYQIPSGRPPYILRFEADGYVPFVSPVFNESVSALSFDVKLSR